MSLHGMFYVLTSVVLVVMGQTALKAGMNRVGAVTRETARHPFALARRVLSEGLVIWGLAAYLLSSLLWILALATVGPTTAYPFLGLTYVAIAGVSVTLLGEWLTPAQWIGVALVATGVLTVAMS